MKAKSNEIGKTFVGEVIAPGFTEILGVNNAKDFISNNYKPGDQIVLYGYSCGGELAKELKLRNISISLVITIDAADGPLNNPSVDMGIPNHIGVNLNIYQTTNSFWY